VKIALDETAKMTILDKGESVTTEVVQRWPEAILDLEASGAPTEALKEAPMDPKAGSGGRVTII
jgi:hypothetical protein